MAVEKAVIEKYVCDYCGKAKAVPEGSLPPTGYHAAILHVRRTAQKNNPIERTRALVFFCDKECFSNGVLYNSYPSEEVPSEVQVQANSLRTPEGRDQEAGFDRIRWGFAHVTKNRQDEDSD